jgi:hypothetical protein
MHTAQVTRGIKPSWDPLIAVVGRELFTTFMWMYALRLDDDVEAHGYKQIATRQYVLVAADGRTFAPRGNGKFEDETPREAIERVFAGWEELSPQPKDPEAVRSLLERHRAAVD